MPLPDEIHEYDDKTLKLVSYLVTNHPKPSVTVLMKLCYFVDLVATKRLKEKITKFNYIRYNYGPFDKDIYRYLEKATRDKQVKEEQGFASESANDFIVLSSGENYSTDTSFLSVEELACVENVITEVGNYGAGALTDIAYKTAPMKKIGAVRGGDQGMYEKLDLNV